MKAIAMVLIVIGLLSLAYQGLTYVTREKVVDLGPVEVTKEHRRTVVVPPILGAVALAGGIALLLSSSRRA
jgi:hypothetical protein